MHFASAIYLPSLFMSVNFAYFDSSRHKASQQQATTAVDNYLIKVNNRNSVQEVESVQS